MEIVEAAIDVLEEACEDEVQENNRVFSLFVFCFVFLSELNAICPAKNKINS